MYIYMYLHHHPKCYGWKEYVLKAVWIENFKMTFLISLVSDPYCVVFCEKKKVTTPVIRNNINPEFNESITVYHRKPDEDITVEVSLVLFFKY